MRVIECPRCRRITEQLESVGGCEHCGIDDVRAGEPIEHEGLDPEQRKERFGKWRWFTATFWLLAAGFEITCFVLLILLAFSLRTWVNFTVEMNYLGIASTITCIGLTLAIAGATVFQPIPASAIGLGLYTIWIAADLFTNPLGICLTFFRLVLMVPVVLGLCYCIKYR